MGRLWPLLLVSALVCGCGDEGESAGPDPVRDVPDASDAHDGSGDVSVDADAPDVGDVPPTDTSDAGWSGPVALVVEGPGFFDRPYPSDDRRVAGVPDLVAFPNPRSLPLLDDLVSTAMQRQGFPQTPVAYFRFDGPLSPRSSSDVVLPGADAPFVLVRLDNGDEVPVVAQTLPADPHVPENVLALAPRPGFVLAPETTWAFVVRVGAGDARGDALVGGGPGVASDHALWDRVDRDGAAAATVFTTGDEVGALSRLSEAVLVEHEVAFGPVVLDEVHERFCELSTTVELPQFQVGEPPFATEGLFGPEFPPAVQRLETVPVTLTVPVGDAPDDGWPLVVYFHGSGGVSSQVVDRGPVLEAGGEQQPGQGPSYVLSAYGFATAGPALPVNPQRAPGAGRLGYLNIANLAAYRDNVRQGALEHRLLIRALLELDVDDPDCGRVRFDPRGVGVMGQSQGAFYATLFAALEPRAGAVAPTGSGGHWSQQILLNQNAPLKPLVAALLQADGATLTFLHPVLHVLQTAWEVADPVIYAPRIVRVPLPGHPAGAVYQPVAPGDTFYPTPVFDTMALAYGHQQAGEVVWPEMQEALALRGLDGTLAYPVEGNLEAGTSVVVQHRGDGLADPHAVFAQLDAVKTQYACFFLTWWAGGAAVVDPAVGCR